MNKDQIKAARKAARKWGMREKLADSGFNDIERGEEGPLMGPSTTSLFQFAQDRLGAGGAPRAFDDLADSDAWLLDFPNSLKARYYHEGMLLAAQALREGGLDHETCFTWALHAQGLGERQICDLLDMPRSRVRKYLRVFRGNVLERLDTEAPVC